MSKYVYMFGGGTADGDGTMKDTLGGKGSGLAEMSRAGLVASRCMPRSLHGYGAAVSRNDPPSRRHQLHTAIAAGEHVDERIKGLILMAPHLFTEEMGLASIAAARGAYETGDLRAKLAKYHAHVDVAFRGWNDAWLDPAFKAWKIEDAVGRWRVPALLIQGADDQYGTLKQVRAIEARSPAPVRSLILEACRHSPQFDQPGATLDAIVRFCAGVVQAEAR